MIAIVLGVLFGWCPPIHSGFVYVGQTAFSLGENAFPTNSACLDPTGCGNEDFLVRDFSDPFFSPVSAARCLRGNELKFVALDLDDADEICSQFPAPIENQPGDDIYIGQAVFFGDLGNSPGLNIAEVRFGDSLVWHAIASTQFTLDDSVTPIVTYSDSEVKQDASRLYYTTQDFTDFGFSSGQPSPRSSSVGRLLRKPQDWMSPSWVV